MSKPSETSPSAGAKPRYRVVTNNLSTPNLTFQQAMAYCGRLGALGHFDWNIEICGGVCNGNIVVEGHQSNAPKPPTVKEQARAVAVAAFQSGRLDEALADREA